MNEPRISILYFAGVRDCVGVPEESILLDADVRTISDLRLALTRRLPALLGRLEGVRFARNLEFVTDSDEVRDGDVIAVIPPVAGG